MHVDLQKKLNAADFSFILKSNMCKLAIYCSSVMAGLMVWVAGTAGLGPLDDHHFIHTIFQGKEFGVYIAPELGRFFPLTAQEYVLASKLFGPSAQMFYLINALKILICGGLLFFCITLTGLGGFASAILWSAVIFSMGMANAVFRLHAGELNVLILMTLFTWCVLMLRDRAGSAVVVTTMYAIVGGLGFFLALFYKELVFSFGLFFSLSEIVRAYWAKKSKPTVFVVVILLISIVYIASYAVWRHIYTTGSYSDFHSTTVFNVLALFASNDPFIIFIVLPVAVFRVFSILRRPECYSIYDSFMLAACAYVSAFLLLRMLNTYYLLPAYAFSVVGLAGVLAFFFNKIPRRAVLAFVFLFCVNLFPVGLSDVLAQKLIVNNHYKFVGFFSEWLQANSEAPRRSQNIVLVGVSPGSGVEIAHSLKTFLVSLGTPVSSFDIKFTEPSDNKKISDFHGLASEQAYVAKVGDLLVFNPFQSIRVKPPLRAPSYSEIYRSDSTWVLPRWSLWDWINICLIRNSDCSVSAADSMRYAGYAAMLVIREVLPLAKILPLEAPAYRIGGVNAPIRMKSGEVREIRVTVQNTGEEVWPADGTLRAGMFVNLAYRWFDQNNQMVLEGDRTPFPEPMYPRDLAKIAFFLKVPKPPGKYKLVISPVQENVRWFVGGDEIEIEVY